MPVLAGRGGEESGRLEACGAGGSTGGGRGEGLLGRGRAHQVRVDHAHEVENLQHLRRHWRPVAFSEMRAWTGRVGAARGGGAARGDGGAGVGESHGEGLLGEVRPGAAG